MDLLAWLKEIPEYPKIYWKDRSGTKSFASAGIGDVSSTSYSWRYFSPTKAAHWADFSLPSPLFPRFIQETDISTSTLQWEKPSIKKYLTTPTVDEWADLVTKTLDAIEQKKLEKCVLARECLYTLEKPIDPWSLIAALEKQVENAYVICIQPTARSAFISLSPEKLFSRTDRTIHTEALAATQKRSCTTSLDLFHPKHQKEFSLVEESIREALHSIALEPLHFSPPCIRTTSGGLQHLYSQVEGTLQSCVTNDKLLEALHPTAALLGFPKEPAFRFLRAHEPFDRGLYGAPLGRISQAESTWAVGIRSCLLFESTARLYSGAGLVSGSDPLLEWEELEHKIALFKKLFSSL